jgi:hypothetical protein
VTTNEGKTSAAPQTVRAQTRARKKRPLKMNSPTSPAAIERLERDLKCVEMRRAGVGWDAIAKQLGYADPGHAYAQFMAVMKAYPREKVEQARDVELDRYDRLQTAIWAQCLDQDSKNQHWAIDRALKLMDQRARLLGINAPVRQEVTVLTESSVDKAIKDLQVQLQAQAAAAGVELPAEV